MADSKDQEQKKDTESPKAEGEVMKPAANLKPPVVQAKKVQLQAGSDEEGQIIVPLKKAHDGDSNKRTGGSTEGKGGKSDEGK